MLAVDASNPRDYYCSRLQTIGAHEMDLSELLSLVLLSTGAEGKRLLERFDHDTERLRGATIEELHAIGKLTRPRACRLRAAFELGRRFLDATIVRGAPLTHPELVERYVRGRCSSLEQEEMHVLGLDAQNQLVTYFVAAKGSMNAVMVSMREVFRPLVREGASSFVLVHNHPSGDLAPSPADHDLTRRAMRFGSEFGIPLLDHLIVGRAGVFSFRAEHQCALASGG